MSYLPKKRVLGEVFFEGSCKNVSPEIYYMYDFLSLSENTIILSVTSCKPVRMQGSTLRYGHIFRQISVEEKSYVAAWMWAYMLQWNGEALQH